MSHSLEEAIQTLFGDSPQTALPPVLLDWTPTPELLAHIKKQGISLEEFIRTGADTFASDPSYFDDLTHSALNSRAVRARAATRKGNRNV